MATTTPEQVRSGLTLVTAAAVADTRTIAASAGTPSEIRASLFAAVPLIVDKYIAGSATLALDWYDEIRAAAKTRHAYSPSPVTAVSDKALMTSVAVATDPLYRLEQEHQRLTDELIQQANDAAMTALGPLVQKSVASGFWETMTVNSAEDPDALGWQRFTRAGACKFCLMLAAKGAVYTEVTADFAAHTSCHCLAGPSFDPNAPRATAMQYVASSKNRTPAQQKALRDYLNQHYPDARG